jgi:hypothetical protein
MPSPAVLEAQQQQTPTSHYQGIAASSSREKMNFIHTLASGAAATSVSSMNRKEDFRRYLEKQGVLDALTKVLVGLYEEPERPTNALEYMRLYLGAASSQHAAVDVEGIQRENRELKQLVATLQQQLATAGEVGSSAQPPHHGRPNRNKSAGNKQEEV